MLDKIRVMLVDDIESHRRRMHRRIEKESKIEVIAEADNGYDAVILAEKFKPDVIIMDIEMEDKWAGINASKRINKLQPEVKIIILTVHQDEKTIYAAFQTGIVDYMLKSDAMEDIVQAIFSAFYNRSPIRPMIAEKIRKEFRKNKQAEENLYSVLKIISELTPSELEIVRLLCTGVNRSQIAKIRMVEVDTIKKQINSILKKCACSNTKKMVEELKQTGIHEALQKMLLT